MTDRDYLWCALNLALDREEELARLCPACRERAEEELCPVCGAPRGERAVNEGFDWERLSKSSPDSRKDCSSNTTR